MDSLVPPLFTSSSRIHCCLACAGTWGAYACLHRAASHGDKTFAEMVETPPSLHPPNQPPTHPSIRPSVHPSAQDPCKEQAGEAGKLTCFFLLRGLCLRKAWVAAEVPKAIEAASARFKTSEKGFRFQGQASVRWWHTIQARAEKGFAKPCTLNPKRKHIFSIPL